MNRPTLIAVEIQKGGVMRCVVMYGLCTCCCVWRDELEVTKHKLEIWLAGGVAAYLRTTYKIGCNVANV